MKQGTGQGTTRDARTWDAALGAVLRGDGLRLVAQPVVDPAHARIGGYELLARFDGPPAASPDVWFAHARRRDLDGALTVRVLEEMHRLRSGLAAGTFCTVNVEPHLLARADVRDTLLGNGALDGVVVELTEHVEGGDAAVLAAALDAIRAAGGLVAMDDAGQGRSGLARMLEIRPDLVKLDRALVTGIDRNPANKAVVQLVGDLAGQLDAWVLAEGVETRGELTELIRMEIPLVQGWAVGQPAPPWAALADDVRTFVTGIRARLRLGDHVLSLVRPTTVHPSDAPAGVAEPGAVRLDSHGPRRRRGRDRPHRSTARRARDGRRAVVGSGGRAAPRHDPARRPPLDAGGLHRRPRPGAGPAGGPRPGRAPARRERPLTCPDAGPGRHPPRPPRTTVPGRTTHPRRPT